MNKIKEFFRQKFGKLLQGNKPSNHAHRGSFQFNERKFNRKPDWKHILFLCALGVFGLFLFSVLALGLMIAIYSIGLPDVRDLDKLSVPQSTTIYDREGNVIYVKHGEENRQYVTYDQISPILVDATVAIEDDKYWEHPGFDAQRIFTAAVSQILPIVPDRGGSTITQQYIKKAFLTDERSIGRKIQELILAIQLEQTFDKKKIVELYLNKIPYGNNAYGIEKAAQIYFNKHAKDLDLAESATLASIPQAPSYYNPYGPHKLSTLTKDFSAENMFFNRNISSEADLQDNEFLRGLIGADVKIGENTSVYIQGRSDLVLKRMVKLGYATEEQMKAALAEMQKQDFIKPYKESLQHAHFVFHILDQLETKYGKDVVENGGLSIYTTLDPKLQEIAERVVKEGALKNEEKYNAKNAALVAIDPKTGQVLAMVGSRDYNDKDVDGNVNVALRYRQPGSSFKPIVYAQAFYNQVGPGSVVFDTETRLGDKNPKNFDGKFWGPMSIRKALGQSRNIPAIKAYFLAGGEKPIIELAQRMGITFSELETNPDHTYSYTLSIGSGAVRLYDMVSAFGVFANGGVRHEPSTILKVQNHRGDVLEEWKQDEGSPVLDPQIAYLITSILSDQSVRLSPNMTVNGQINAAKSGTSNGTIMKNGVKVYFPNDLLTIGYTTRLAAGVWTGNNNPEKDGTVSAAADGISTAAPIWKAFMSEALSGQPSEEFPRPEGIKEVQISKASGKLPGPLTPPDQITTDIFASFNVPTEIDNSYVQVDIDTLCGKLANEFTPPEMIKKTTFINQHDIAPYPEWEQGAQEWLKAHVGETDPNNATLVIGPPPTESCPGRSAQNYANRPTITILNPYNGSTQISGSKIPVQVSIGAPTGVSKVEYYLDGEFKYKTVTAPYEGLIRLPYGENSGAHHNITAKVFDNAGYVGTASIDITIGNTTAYNTSPTGSGTSGSYGSTSSGGNTDIYGQPGASSSGSSGDSGGSVIGIPAPILPVTLP